MPSVFFDFGKTKYNVIILFATDLVHVSNGFTDVDSNQLVTPEFTVTETGNHLILNLRHNGDFSLNVYVLNELHHRLPDRLYYEEVVSDVNHTGRMMVGYFVLG